MSLKSMIDGVNLPMSVPAPETVLNDLGISIPNPDFGKLIPNPASLFKNPAEAALAEMSKATSGIALLGGSIAGLVPSFNPSVVVSGMMETSKKVTAQLTEKISAVSTELPLALAAQKQEDLTKTVDAILSKTPADIVDPIAMAFPVPAAPGEPTPCPGDHVAAVMGPLLKANDEVAKAVAEAGKKFDMSPVTAPLYAAINSIPGISATPITDGAGLLKALGSVPAALSASVSSTISGVMASNTAIIDNLKTSFADVYTPAIPNPADLLGAPLEAAKGAAADLTSKFDTMIGDAKAAVAKSFAVITGANTVNMLTSTNPCVAKVMGAIVKPEAVDIAAITVSAAVKNKDIAVEGQAAVDKTKTAAPIEEFGSTNTKLSTKDMTASGPDSGCTVNGVCFPERVAYTTSETNQMYFILEFEENRFRERQADLARQRKEIEDWKLSVNYEGLKIAAGASLNALYGTSTNPIALEEWKIVYDQYIPKRDNFNNIVLLGFSFSEARILAIRKEFKFRVLYGKNPYVYAESRGVVVPSSNRSTFLDPDTNTIVDIRKK